MYAPYQPYAPYAGQQQPPYPPYQGQPHYPPYPGQPQYPPYQGQPPQYPPYQGTQPYPPYPGQAPQYPQQPQPQYAPYHGQPPPQFPPGSGQPPQPQPGPNAARPTSIPRNLPNHTKVTIYEKLHYEFWDGEKQVFFVNNWGKDKVMPDVSFHTGWDENAPGVGGIKYTSSDDVDLGLGDPRQKKSMAWTRMKRSSKVSTKYTFTTAEGTFTWKRTSHVSFSDSLQLVDEKTEDVVALFKDSSSGSKKKLGYFDIHRDLGDAWKMMVFLSGIALREKFRLDDIRESRASSNMATSMNNLANAFN